TFIKWVLVLAILGTAGVYGYMRFGGPSQEVQPDYNTVQVHLGDLIATSPGTGTVEPEDLIELAPQVAGRIIEFGRDTKGHAIDYGSEVKKDMLIAKIDDSTYVAAVKAANAALSSAKANVERSKADLEQFRAKENQAKRDWERAQRLGPSEAL